MNDHLDEQSPEGLGSDELALRRMLHEVVQDVEPRDGTLDHLRRAVPARRARKRQAAVGMAAAALFLGTAVPALVHVTGVAGPDANPSIAGHGSAAQGGAGEGESQGGGHAAGGGSAGRTDGSPDGGATSDEHDQGGSTGPGSGSSADPTASAPADAPVCTAEQLSASGQAGAPDSTGAVYGGFRVTNISGGSCTVSGPGTVTPFAQGAADPTRVSLANHAAGDAAVGLPDPSLETQQLVLLPGAAFEVKFAWVPTEACSTDSGGGSGGGGDGSGGTGTGSGGGGTGGDTGVPTPTPTPTDGTGDTTDGTTTTGEPGMSTQLVTEDGGTSGSVGVSYTAEAGGPSAAATVPDACAGTVYRTGMLSGS
ncbi:hypothetical protein ABZZ79_23270 [Streptomyces sp. NPDC006458]|uniref:hypothetical protein n=1 Tax=Streptomyces sp. NPDC006458 TaxID=3154302 RepID=UPI0033B419A4